MPTDALPAEPEWLTRSRVAAYCARRRLGLDSSEITPQDMEDLIQVARMVYWRQLRDGRHPAFCFVSARNAVRNYFLRQIRGRNPRNPLSLDVPAYDDGSLPDEWLLAMAPAGDESSRTDWLSDACPDQQGGEVLEGVLFEAWQAAGFSQRQLTRYWDTIQTDNRITDLGLAARCHTNASIAEILGTTEGTVRNRRQRIRRLLENLLPPDMPPLEYSRTGGNQQVAHEIRMPYPDKLKPAIP